MEGQTDEESRRFPAKMMRMTLNLAKTTSNTVRVPSILGPSDWIRLKTICRMNLNGCSDGFGGLFVGHDLFVHWGDDQRSVDKRRLIEMQGHSHRLQLFEHDVTFLRRSQVIGFFGRWNRRVQVDILDLAQISEQSLGGKGGEDEEETKHTWNISKDTGLYLGSCPDTLTKSRGKRGGEVEETKYKWNRPKQSDAANTDITNFVALFINIQPSWAYLDLVAGRTWRNIRNLDQTRRDIFGRHFVATLSPDL